jgi:hypothetical protein
LPDKNNPITKVSQDLNVEHLVKRLDMLDERLDNMDSVITSLVERIMEKPLTLEVTCPKCGQAIQVNITANVRFRG